MKIYKSQEETGELYKEWMKSSFESGKVLVIEDKKQAFVQKDLIPLLEEIKKANRQVWSVKEVAEKNERTVQWINKICRMKGLGQTVGRSTVLWRDEVEEIESVLNRIN